VCKRDAGFFTAASGENDVAPPPKPPTEQTRESKEANLEMSEESKREREREGGEEAEGGRDVHVHRETNGERGGKESQACPG